jgi:hypothetical protein
MTKIAISPLDASNYERFDMERSWDLRQKKIEPYIYCWPKEFVIGRLATETTDFTQESTAARESYEPDNILEQRLDLFRAISEHCRRNGPGEPLLVGRTGSRTLYGKPPGLRKDRIWASPIALVEQELDSDTNGPFRYMHRRFTNYQGNDSFVPGLAVFDGSKLEPANGNRHDDTVWISKTWDTLGALVALHYFSPKDFTF